MKNNNALIEYYNDWAQTYNEDRYVKDEYSVCEKRVHFVYERFKELGCKHLVDVGCGACYPMVLWLNNGFTAKGFDISPKMIEVGGKYLIANGYSAELICKADLAKEIPFKDEHFDGMMMHGAINYVENEELLLKNAYSMLKQGGVMFCEIRNELMSAFSMNEYSRQYFFDLIDIDKFPQEIVDDISTFYSKMAGGGKKSQREENAPWKSKFFTRFYNPLTIDKLFNECGYEIKGKYFFHWHCLPPIFEEKYPDLFKKMSYEMEDPYDWRGYLMASTFVVEAVRQ